MTWCIVVAVAGGAALVGVVIGAAGLLLFIGDQIARR